jgi:hypothetical protein
MENGIVHDKNLKDCHSATPKEWLEGSRWERFQHNVIPA